MRYLPVSSYKWVSSFWVCIVFFVVVISLCGLHSIVEIWVCGIFVGGGMNLVSLVCSWVKCESIMLL